MRGRFSILSLALLGAFASGPLLAAEPPALEPPAAEPVPPEERPEATWRFREEDKTVKVIVLGGSTGAYGRQPYAAELERLCKDVEVRNLSKTGLGAFPQKQEFRHEVMKNRWLSPRNPDHEYWLVHAGTVNSIATPEATNHHVKNTIALAHAIDMKVVGLTLTPWGDEKDKRFKGVSGMRYREWSDLTADFILGRLTPREALGSYAAQRKFGGDADWDPSEIPDVAVDLYDSALRNKRAMPRDFAEARKVLEQDAEWTKAHRNADPGVREAQLIADASYLAALPLWYLRTELRSFDHIHPNQTGHALIAATICPKMPASWGCACEPMPPAAEDSGAAPDAP